MKNRVRSLLTLVLGLLLFLFLWNVKPNCLFKELFSFPCPACGMTRAFECIFSFDIIGSFSYNILAFPLFVFGLVCVGILIYDLISGKDLFFKWLFDFLEKYYLVIFALVLISWVVNIYKCI